MQNRILIVFRKLILMLTAILMMGIGLSGCSEGDPLQGLWVEPTYGVMLEFGSDGELTMEYNGVSATMIYELEDPNVLIFKSEDETSIPEQRLTYTLDEDTLILTLDGIETKFLREK